MGVTAIFGKFEWDQEKESENIRKHGIDFRMAALVFADPWRLIAIDAAHSDRESRYFLHRSHQREDSDGAIYHALEASAADWRRILEKRKGLLCQRERIKTCLLVT
ncbi:MAG: BrnT family toxin [Bdellovibrionota bacterium]